MSSTTSAAFCRIIRLSSVLQAFCSTALQGNASGALSGKNPIMSTTSATSSAHREHDGTPLHTYAQDPAPNTGRRLRLMATTAWIAAPSTSSGIVHRRCAPVPAPSIGSGRTMTRTFASTHARRGTSSTQPLANAQTHAPTTGSDRALR